MHRYYYIDSNGEDTNLQLYSLKQAKLQWVELQKELSQMGEVENFHERCVFLICTIGLSVTQLLGQNNPNPFERVPSPKKLFESLVEANNLDPAFKYKFMQFIDTYDQCRHFGLTNDNSRHGQVSEITLKKTEELYKFGLLVWDIVIKIFRKDPQNELDELKLSVIEDVS